jgi:hypothetical protein
MGEPRTLQMLFTRLKSIGKEVCGGEVCQVDSEKRQYMNETAPNPVMPAGAEWVERAREKQQENVRADTGRNCRVFSQLAGFRCVCCIRTIARRFRALSCIRYEPNQSTQYVHNGSQVRF